MGTLNSYRLGWKVMLPKRWLPAIHLCCPKLGLGSFGSFIISFMPSEENYSNDSNWYL
jgi:hypothetical protein